MWMRSILLCASAVALVVGFCQAQEQPGKEEPKVREGVQQPKPGEDVPKPGLIGPGPWSREGQKEQLLKELKLDQAQQADVNKIFEEHDKKVGGLREAFHQAPEDMDRLREIREEMLAARQANDQQRMEELRAKMQEIQEERRQRLAPIQEQLEAAEEELHDRLAAVMHPDQKGRFDELWDEWTEMRTPMAAMRNPQMLRRMVERLPDLTSEQKQQINELFEVFKKAAREGEGKRSPEYAKRAKQLYDDVMKVLTREQQETLNKKMQGPRGDHGRPWSKGEPRGQPGAEGQTDQKEKPDAGGQPEQQEGKGEPGKG